MLRPFGQVFKIASAPSLGECHALLEQLTMGGEHYPTQRNDLPTHLPTPHMLNISPSIHRSSCEVLSPHYLGVFMPLIRHHISFLTFTNRRRPAPRSHVFSLFLLHVFDTFGPRETSSWGIL